MLSYCAVHRLEKHFKSESINTAEIARRMRVSANIRLFAKEQPLTPEEEEEYLRRCIALAQKQADESADRVKFLQEKGWKKTNGGWKPTSDETLQRYTHPNGMGTDGNPSFPLYPRSGK